MTPTPRHADALPLNDVGWNVAQDSGWADGSFLILGLPIVCVSCERRVTPRSHSSFYSLPTIHQSLCEVLKNRFYFHARLGVLIVDCSEGRQAPRFRQRGRKRLVCSPISRLDEDSRQIDCFATSGGRTGLAGGSEVPNPERTKGLRFIEAHAPVALLYEID